jgi:glycosyltransferase involved in cell wall biosynthesis
MNIVQITPGAGRMYCGNCLRDNALVRALRKMGHQSTMVPLYLPLTLDEPDESAGTPTFFGGINVYLEQKSALFRQSPGWLRDLLSSPALLKWAAGKTAQTRPQDLGDVTISMLRGEEGLQARELDVLLSWLAAQPKPDVICLSNALLVGLARRLHERFQVPVVCTLQGEDTFLDGLPEPYRRQCWSTLAERAAELDLLIAPSHYFARLMGDRLRLPQEKLRVVYNGINLEGYEPAPGADFRATEPAVGFFARMCREKGLHTLVEAYIQLRSRSRVPRVKLRIGGSCGPADAPFVDTLRQRLSAAGLLGDVEFCPNPDRSAKIAFLKSLSVFSVPALYGEAFGLYLLEAWAAGVPVVQPRTASFPELIEATGGGILCAPGDPGALAESLEQLLLDPARASSLAAAGRSAVFEKFTAEAMARSTLELYSGLCRAE